MNILEDDYINHVICFLDLQGFSNATKKAKIKET